MGRARPFRVAVHAASGAALVLALAGATAPSAGAADLPTGGGAAGHAAPAGGSRNPQFRADRPTTPRDAAPDSGGRHPMVPPAVLVSLAETPAPADRVPPADPVGDGGRGDLPGAAAPEGFPGLAGSRAGEGREHPGRSADQPDLMAPLPSSDPEEPADGGPPDTSPPGGSAVPTQPADPAPVPQQADGADGYAGGDQSDPAAAGQLDRRPASGRHRIAAPAAPVVPSAVPRRAGQRPGAAPVPPAPPPLAGPGPSKPLETLMLGTGMALVGLGIAALGLRLRRR